MFRAPRIFALLAATLCFAAGGCNTPEAVAKFCGTSNTTLTAAIPVFQDLRGSCLREVNLHKGIGVFTAVDSDPACSEVAKQADGAVAALRILADYFSAVSAVASYGKIDTASHSANLAGKTADALGAGSLAQQAIKSLANLATLAATSGYQQHALNRDLVKASTSIGVVTDALATILQKGYIDVELKAEDQKLADRYREFAINNHDGSLVLQMDDRWHAERQAIAAKRAAATHLISALTDIKQGSADLAEHAHSLKAKELPALLDPYIAQLQALIPQIQQAF